jgi:hypothetical protein
MHLFAPICQHDREGSRAMLRRSGTEIHIRRWALATGMVAACLTSSAPASRAQDAHYWSIQNGADATLLGGTVIANDADLSACYYNPGALARHAEASALSMFSKVTTSVETSLGASQSFTVESDVGASAPGMFAAVIPGLHLAGDDVFAFSYTVRQSSKLDLSGAILSSPTVPAAALDLSIFQDIYDGWYGLTWSKDLGEVGVGLSMYFSSVSYRQRIEDRGAGVTIDRIYFGGDSLYYNFACRRLVFRGGVSWIHGPFALGTTVTLPSLRLPWSSGTVSVAHTYFDETDSVATGEISLSRQEDVDADYKEPLSVALGGQAQWGAFDFYASAEWFAEVQQYDVLETAPLQRQIPPDEIILPITQRRDSVLNVGGGVALRATNWLSFFSSVRTDRSYRNSNAVSFVGLGAYDLTHVTAGLSVAGEKFEVSLGGLYATGEADGPFRINPLPTAGTVDSHTEFDQKGFVLAFSADF